MVNLTNPEERKGFYKTVNTFLTSKSKRGMNYLRKDYGLTNKQLDTIEGANNWADFYPTPSHCINNEKVKNALDGYSPILEPTAGLGNIMNELLLMFPDVELIGNENMPDLVEFLKSMYPKQKITKNNFLKMNIPDNTNAIVCNPPFSFGNDKKFYYDFLFKILADMNNKKNDYMKPIIFICPELVNNKYHDNDTRHDDFTFLIYDILHDKRLSIKKLISLCKIYLDITITPKQAKLIKEGDEDHDIVIDVNNALEFAQGKLLLKCKGFGGTSITANVYEFILYKNYRKGYGEEEEEEPKKEPIKSEKKRNNKAKLKENNNIVSNNNNNNKMNKREREKREIEQMYKSLKIMITSHQNNIKKEQNQLLEKNIRESHKTQINRNINHFNKKLKEDNKLINKLIKKNPFLESPSQEHQPTININNITEDLLKQFQK